jgi:hypothetical protein
MGILVDVGFLGVNTVWTCRQIVFTAEDGGSKFLPNVGIHLQVQKLSKPGRPTSASSLPTEH